MSNIEYIALYRKYRPMRFEDVVGQSHVTQTLTNQVKNNRVAHAYLFSGSRGTGKTSVAKILSRAVNCTNTDNGEPCNTCENCRGILDGSILDVLEIDAASNNSVDNVRSIRDEIIYTPSRAKYKVYIIDEAHMLSLGAFNALLKSLEEPPGHVVFILATTEPQKIPATIISRCQRFDFKRIKKEEVLNKLKEIVKEIDAQVEDDALELISGICEGGMRDALSILDQSISVCGKVSYKDVVNIVGMVDGDILFDISQKIGNKDVVGVIKDINDVYYQGKEMKQFVIRLISHFRDILIAKSVEDTGDLIITSKGEIEKLKAISGVYTQEELIDIINILSEVLDEVKRTTYAKILLETAVIKLCSDNQTVVTLPVQTPKEKIREEEPKEKTKPVKVEQDNKNSSDIASLWKQIVSDLEAKGQSKMILQCLKDIELNTEKENTLTLMLPHDGEYFEQKIKDKKVLEEIKDSVLKVTGRELSIKVTKKEKVSEDKLETFKEKANIKGLGDLIKEY